jgi:hypothetical protein
MAHVIVIYHVCIYAVQFMQLYLIYNEYTIYKYTVY